MELRILNTFLKVAQLQSFSKAADSLGYSQSAITVQVQQLENELGVRMDIEAFQKVETVGELYGQG